MPSGPLLPGFIDALNKSGFTFRHLLIWIKQQFVIGMNDYHYRHEALLYGWLANGAHYWGGGRGLQAAELPVALVNPRWVRSFARGVGQLAKTDRIDARLLALYAERAELKVRTLPDEQTRELRAVRAAR